MHFNIFKYTGNQWLLGIACALLTMPSLAAQADSRNVDAGKSALSADAAGGNSNAEIKVSDSRDVSLTIYNQNFGLVKDVRDIDLEKGVNYVRFEDVASKIDPTTVSFTSLTAPKTVTVREQNFQYDLLDPTTILTKSVGKDVKFRQVLPGGQISEISGILLNSPQPAINYGYDNLIKPLDGLVVKTSNGIVLNPEGQAELAELPAGLVSKPSLLWKIEASKGGAHKTEIAYQTAGLNWHCDYVAIVNEDDTTMDLTSWVTMDNQSGASYKNASLKLVAGDVHKVSERFAANKTMVAAADLAGSGQQQFQEQTFGEYHLYKLAGRTNVNDKETKQMSLFNSSNISCQKKYVFEANSTPGYYIPRPEASQKVKVKMEVVNSNANGLGMPMPKGRVQVYKKDQDGALQLVGEDSIDHTPRDEKIRIYVGDAFDIVGESKQTDNLQVSNRVRRASYEIDIRNHKDKAVTITDIEHAYGDWKVISSSQDYVKRDAHTFEFALEIPANGQTKLTYTIESKY